MRALGVGHRGVDEPARVSPLDPHVSLRARGDDHGLAVGRERERFDGGLVVGELRGVHRPARRPEDGRVSLVAREDVLAVGREREREHGALVLRAERRELLARGHVPELDRLVPASRRGGLAVARERGSPRFLVRPHETGFRGVSDRRREGEQEEDRDSRDGGDRSHAPETTAKRAASAPCATRACDTFRPRKRTRLPEGDDPMYEMKNLAKFEQLGVLAPGGVRGVRGVRRGGAPRRERSRPNTRNSWPSRWRADDAVPGPHSRSTPSRRRRRRDPGGELRPDDARHRRATSRRRDYSRHAHPRVRLTGTPTTERPHFCRASGRPCRS